MVGETTLTISDAEKELLAMLRNVRHFALTVSRDENGFKVGCSDFEKEENAQVNMGLGATFVDAWNSSRCGGY